jgi:hypothetical protein
MSLTKVLANQRNCKDSSSATKNGGLRITGWLQRNGSAYIDGNVRATRCTCSQ